MQVMPTELITFAQVQYAAMTFLAIREHSAYELQKKLAIKFVAAEELINQVVDNLIERDLQSDARFAQAFTRMRMTQGKGPVRIVYDLKDKHVSAEIIDDVLQATDQVWFDLAKEVRTKKFGLEPVLDNKNKAKQMRFLHYRGFTTNQIQSSFVDG